MGGRLARVARMSRTKTGVAAHIRVGTAVLSLTLSCLGLTDDEAPPAPAAPECRIDGDCQEGESCLDGACRPCEPSAEVCNGVDDDCDREVDEDWQIGRSCLAQGQCGYGM